LILRRSVGSPPASAPADDPDNSDDSSTAQSQSGHVDAVWSAKFSRDGTKIVTASRDWTAVIWNATTGGPITRIAGHQREVRSAEFSPNGKFVITSSGALVDATDNTARLWDAETGSQALVLGNYRSDSYTRLETASTQRSGHQGTVWTATFSPDGGRIATASADGTARLWDAQTGRQIAVFRGHGQEVVTAAFSPDGKRVVTASRDGTARLWNAETG